MLVLSRKEGQRVVIGKDVYVTVLQVRGDRVKLGFECPIQVPVHREEVAKRIGEKLVCG
jgi:carbon storage regulator